MSQDFNTYDQITLRPKDYSIDFQFEFPTCSDASSNDGFLPNGTTLTAVSATAFDEGNVLNNDLIMGSPIVSNNIVTATLKYPGQEGRYTIRFMLYEGTDVYQADFESIFCFEE